MFIKAEGIKGRHLWKCEIKTFTNKLEVLTTSTTISVNETAENVNSGIHTDSSQPITSKLEVSTTPNATSETTVNVDCVIHNLVTMSPSFEQ
jgi:hypothetical protein